MSQSKRIEKLEQLLSPRRAVMRFIIQMRTFDTFEAFVAWDMSEAGLAWSDALMHDLEASTRQRHPGVSGLKLNAALSQANERFCQYLDLALAPLMRWDSERYRYLYLSSTLENLHLKMEQTPLDRVAEMSDYLHAFFDASSSLYLELVLERAMIKTLSDRYFGSLPLLFPDQEALLDTLIEQTERDINRYNERIYADGQHFNFYKGMDLEIMAQASVNNTAWLIQQIRQEVQMYHYSRQRQHLKAAHCFQRWQAGSE